jgi:hypothetical protein
VEYLKYSVEELEKWVRPDRMLPYYDSNPAVMGMHLWSGTALDAAKPHIQEWRERDRAAAELRGREFEAERSAQTARRKGMLKTGALMAVKICEALACTRTELDRWAAGGRLSAGGEIFVYGGGAHKSVNALA